MVWKRKLFSDMNWIVGYFTQKLSKIARLNFRCDDKYKDESQWIEVLLIFTMYKWIIKQEGATGFTVHATGKHRSIAFKIAYA